jgi:hypothetical protein
MASDYHCRGSLVDSIDVPRTDAANTPITEFAWRFHTRHVTVSQCSDHSNVIYRRMDITEQSTLHRLRPSDNQIQRSTFGVIAPMHVAVLIVARGCRLSNYIIRYRVC